MMRSLWTAASGMTSQQLNVDNIANNLANINTTGYKRETVEFKSLLYQTIQKNSYNSNGDPKPVGVQVGLGVRSTAISANFAQGALLASEGAYNFALEGTGFFMLHKDDGSIDYTRNGTFFMSLTQNGYQLSSSDGYPVLDVNGNPIVFPYDMNLNRLDVDRNGNFTYADENNNMQMLGVQMGIAVFNNPVGLYKIGDSTYGESEASGGPQIMSPDAANTKVMRHYLEGSNVQAADEMVNLIVAQRAYEMNSKAIVASDQMLQQANNLRQ